MKVFGIRMRTPMYFSADQIKTWDVQCCIHGGLWTQARPESITGINLWRRLSAAWMVFRGKGDVLVWTQQ